MAASSVNYETRHRVEIGSKLGTERYGDNMTIVCVLQESKAEVKHNEAEGKRILIKITIHKDLESETEIQKFNASLKHLFDIALPKCEYVKNKNKIPIFVKVYANKFSSSTNHIFSVTRTKRIFNIATSYCTSEFMQDVTLIECYLKTKAISTCVNGLLRLCNRQLSKKIKCYCPSTH